MSDKLKNQSNFVTIVAWIFIIIFSFLTLISIMQNVMLFTFFRNIDKQIQESRKNVPDDLKESNKNIFDIQKILYFIFPISLIISLTVLISSIGLLKRKNWARFLFISILFVIIGFTISLFVLQIYSLLNLKSDNSFTSLNKTFNYFIIFMIIFSILISSGISISFVLINIKLLSNKIKLEFVKNSKKKINPVA